MTNTKDREAEAPRGYPTLWAHFENGELIHVEERITDLCCASFEAVEYRAIPAPSAPPSPEPQAAEQPELKPTVAELLTKERDGAVAHLKQIHERLGKRDSHEPFMLASCCIDEIAGRESDLTQARETIARLQREVLDLQRDNRVSQERLTRIRYHAGCAVTPTADPADRETIGKVRLFRGDTTHKLARDGSKADPKKWYHEHVDDKSDVLASDGYDSREEAHRAATGIGS